MFLETILQKICLYHLGVTEFVLIHQKSKENSKNIYQCTQGFDNRVRCKFVFVVYLFLFLYQDKKDKRTKLQEETKSSAPIYRLRHKRKRWVPQNRKLIRAFNFVKTTQIHSFRSQLLWPWKIDYWSELLEGIDLCV